MTMNRRDFLKISAASSVCLAAGARSSDAAPQPAPPEAVGILYDATLCIGCKACMVNCKRCNSAPGGALSSEEAPPRRKPDAQQGGKNRKAEGFRKDSSQCQAAGSIPYEYRGPEKIYDAPTDLSATTLNIIKAYKNGAGTNKDQEKDGYSFVKLHCLHCLDPACVSVCPVAALTKDKQTGVVSYDRKKCIGCRYCQTACPFSIPQFEWSNASPEIRKCQLCTHRMAKGGYAACCEFCPTGASLYGKVNDLRIEAEKRIALKPGAMYDYPLRRLGDGASMPKKVSAYYQHVYGLEETGGTQYLLLAGVSFDKLGFNPRITSQTYSDLTWAYNKKIPWLIAALLVAGTACHLVTRKKNDSDGA